MERSPVPFFYKKGRFPSLDKKWEQYRRMKVFVGVAWDKALDQGEVDNLYEI